jgi:hypothetical protein|tara:strand:+ start:23 stop:283 length:261 start_codon:yes stop_codon:yes gene_type:complete
MPNRLSEAIEAAGRPPCETKVKCDDGKYRIDFCNYYYLCKREHLACPLFAYYSMCMSGRSVGKLSELLWKEPSPFYYNKVFGGGDD